MTASTLPRSLSPSADASERLRRLIDLHFHPEHGSSYWLRRQEALAGVSATASGHSTISGCSVRCRPATCAARL
jgi:hypothetical protein